MTRWLMVLMVIVLILPLGLATAQQPTPGSKEENACYSGGSMEGKCTTLWHWICGYYLARWQSAGGWLTPNNSLNSACTSLLPPAPLFVAESDTPPSSICITAFGGTYCLSNPASSSDSDNDGDIDEYYLFIDTTNCPPFYNGLQFDDVYDITSLFFFGFTPADFAALGLPTDYCYYY